MEQSTAEDVRSGRDATAPRLGQMAPSGRLRGRKLLVIGGGQDARGQAPADTPVGNGRAIAVQAAREGAEVVVTDLDADRIVGTTAMHAMHSIVADASDEGLMEQVFIEAVDVLGGLDAVVVNVGIGGPAWLSGTSSDDWDRVFAVNARAHFIACKLGLQYLADDSAIVLIASVAGTRSGSRIPAYDASKAALGGLMRHAAFEGQRRCIRVNVVAPGLIDTSIGREATRHRPSRVSGRLPLGREGTGWEIAHAVTFLLSDEASYVNAQWIGVDGGL
jgi:NAD(P)-dependent dehydrogenase (short-subunit alcohol dehydrogenase family)